MQVKRPLEKQKRSLPNRAANRSQDGVKVETELPVQIRPAAGDENSVRLATLEALRSFVAGCLAAVDDLEADVYTTTEQQLYRLGKPCGISFCLHGPRNLKLTAIWDAHNRRIVCYNSHGDRVRGYRLSQSPPLPSEQAEPVQ